MNFNSFRKTWTDKRDADFAAAIEKAGVNVQAEGVRVENTWGDHCGFGFHGADEATLERAVVWFEAWLKRNPFPGSYVAQSAQRPAINMLRIASSNGVVTWHHKAPAAYTPAGEPGSLTAEVVSANPFKTENTTDAHYSCGHTDIVFEDETAKQTCPICAGRNYLAKLQAAQVRTTGRVVPFVYYACAE